MSGKPEDTTTGAAVDPKTGSADSPEVTSEKEVGESRKSLGDNGKNLSRKSSSSSTSSFEDIKLNVKADDSRFLEPPTITIENEKRKPALKGALTFKTTSLDDPTYYAQTTSTSDANKSQTSRYNGKKFNSGKKERAPPIMATEDRDPENINDIVMVRIIFFLQYN